MTQQMTKLSELLINRAETFIGNLNASPYSNDGYGFRRQ